MSAMVNDKPEASPNRIPSVTVLMPVYNGERFLKRAIDSALGQTYDDFELVAVDDGSTDGSIAILRQYAQKDPRVRVIELPHVGSAEALNAGLAAARGEFLARLDCDDESTPDRLAIEVDYLRRHPEVIAVGGQVLEIDEDDDPIGPMDGLFAEHNEIEAAMFKLEWAIHLASSMIRTAAMRAMGGFPAIFPHGDCEQAFRLAEMGKLANVSQTTLRYRRHAGCVTIRSPDRSKLVDALTRACARRNRPLIIPPNRYIPVEESPRQSLARRHRIWGWRALRAGYVRTARKYAWRALMMYPVSYENWVLAICSIRGR